jgi:lysosomal alpha-mannosidase
MESTERLNRAVAVAQHHDAITGTEKQHVANDYHVRLDSAINNFMNDAELAFCPMLNISQCVVTENIEGVQAVVAYNPLGHVRSSYIHLPVATAKNWIVKDDVGQILKHQITPLPEPVKTIPGRRSNAEYSLTFYASDVPALGIRSFTVEKSAVRHQDGSIAKKVQLKIGQEFDLNRELRMKITETGLLMKSTRFNSSVLNEFGYYKGHPGNNTEFEFRASGAYIFRPLGQDPVILKLTSSNYVYGPLFGELHLSFDNSVSLVYRLLLQPHLYAVETIWMVGPISVEDGIGKEFISRWQVQDEQFNQQGIFYTDANGRQTMKRIRNFRPSYDVENATLEEPVSSNYYPINTAIYIQDPELNWQMTVVTDRAQGGSSLRDGELEVMLHRRLLDDDAFGVGEPLNEQAFGAGLVTRGTNYGTFFNDIEGGNALRRQLSNELFGNLIIFFPSSNELQSMKNTFPAVPQASYQLPTNINLLTFEPWLNASSDYPNKQYLVRLEHLFEEGEHANLSQPVTVSLAKLFGPTGTSIGELSWMRETTLGGNRWKDETKRLDWKVKGEEATEEDPLRSDSNVEGREGEVEDVLLNAMEIRTFIVEFEKAKSNLLP